MLTAQVATNSDLINQAAQVVTDNIAAIGAAALAVTGLSFGYRWFRRTVKG